jgi:hypothetical protein
MRCSLPRGPGRKSGRAGRFAAIIAKNPARPKARYENVKSRGGAIGWFDRPRRLREARDTDRQNHKNHYDSRERNRRGGCPLEPVRGIA